VTFGRTATAALGARSQAMAAPPSTRTAQGQPRLHRVLGPLEVTVYRKLGVSSRRAAVERSREVGPFLSA
jgi:hypothetical protein